MNEHSIGKTIATLRKAKGWTQVELAKKLNVSDKTVSKWESESGYPEISQLPAMAALFHVSLDYLMTGKAPEKEVITISKAELCAKNDDVSMSHEVVDLPRDESNNNIVDYILKYKSLNVFAELCKSYPKFIERFPLMDAITLSVLSNSLYLLDGKVFRVDRNCQFTFKNVHEIKDLLPLEDMEYFKNTESQYSCLIPREFFTMIVTNKTINEETLNILLSNQNGRECVWYHAFPYIIDEAYKNENIPLLQRLLDISRKNNAIAYENIKPVYDNYDGYYTYSKNYFFIASKYTNRGYGIVRILESTIKSAMERGDFETVNTLNEINIGIEAFLTSSFGKSSNEDFTRSALYIANEDEIRIAKLKLDKSMSKEDLQIQEAIRNGILSIKDIKETKNLAVVKKAFCAYPIHPIELIYKLYQEKKWRDLFEFSVDYDNSLSDAILSQDQAEIENCILKSWTDTHRAYGPYRVNNGELYISGERNTTKSQKSIPEVMDYLNKVRQRIIEELSNESDKEKILAELTKDFFYSELNKGNRESVIIKLCVRLEAILKCDYGYEGTFSDMLNRFCSQFNDDDDEGNNYDPYTPKLLHTLRKNRNSIVHSEKLENPMSDDEIKQCIDYVCSL